MKIIGSEMFTIDDIRNIAVKIEENGEKTYRQVSKEASSPEIAEMFQWMADEEKRHAQWFMNFRSTKPLDKDQEELAVMGKNLLQDMVKDQTFSLDKKALADEKNLTMMLNQSMTFELDTVLFYEFISGLISDEETLEQLKLIIQEERKHAEHIADLVESLEEKVA